MVVIVTHCRGWLPARRGRRRRRRCGVRSLRSWRLYDLVLRLVLRFHRANLEWLTSNSGPCNAGTVMKSNQQQRQLKTRIKSYALV